MRFNDIKDLPETHACNPCGEIKPIAEMLLVYNKRERHYKLRPRCKRCHNETERGKRREYKTEYLRKWRKRNAKLNKSYWDNPVAKEKITRNAYRRFTEKHEAILIQGRMNRRGMNVGIKEAEELLEKYGRCYPSPQGLTEKGRRACERIRSRLRARKSKRISSFQIRLMVYEDDSENNFVIEPALQEVPYQAASARLRQWHRSRRILGEIERDSRSLNLIMKKNTEETFWSKVALTANPDKCWNWLGYSRYGYGMISYKNKNYRAHRLAWFFIFGTFPEAILLHSCDNSKCVNPNHLREGTDAENVLDRQTRSRQAKGEAHGRAKLTAEQVARIKVLLDEGIKRKHIAAMFGVKRNCIGKINARVSWALI